MLANHPAIAAIHAIDRDWKRRGLVAAGSPKDGCCASAARARYDLLLHLTEHPRGLTLAHLLRPRYAVTRERADGARLWRRRFTHFYRLPRQTPRHAVEANLDALRRIGVYPDAADKKLVLVPGAAAHARVDALLREHGIAPMRFVHAHPGSRWLFKCWPAASSAALFERIVAGGHRLVVTGAPDPRERALVDAIRATVSPSTRARSST